MSRTLRISRALKECKEDKARLYKECDTLTSHLSRDLKTFEKHFGTTAQKVRDYYQQREQQREQEREQQQRMTPKVKKLTSPDLSFQEAQKKDPALTLGEYQADLFLKDLAAGKVKFAPLHTEEKGPPVTASEHTATGGRKTRRKRRRKKKKSRRKRKTRHRRKRRKTRKKRR